MKKFLIFCLICVVTVSLGLMTYRFLTLEETMTVNSTVFEVNKGEEVPLVVTRENQKDTTIITYESLDEDVVSYDKTLGKFIAQGQGGKARLRITSSARGSVPIMITVTVGDGTANCPYYIKSAYDLAQIGVAQDIDGKSIVTRPLDAYYSLSNDIDLSTYNEGVWTPIGSKTNAFTGGFNANGHTISGLKITSNTESAGLFAKIALNDKNTNNIYGGLILDNVTISGEFSYVGALAGINEGLVTKVSITNSTISSSLAQSVVGAVFGLQNGQLERASVINSTISSTASNTSIGGIIGELTSETSLKALVDRSYTQAVNVKGSYNVGGLVGLVKGGLIVDSYSKSVENEGLISTDSTSTSVNLGGLAGRIEVVGTELETAIVDCYSTAKIGGSATQNRGQLIGYIVDKKVSDVPVRNKLYGLYYESTANSAIYGIGYIATNGAVTSREIENSNYEFVYNTLNSTVETARVSGEIYSHSNIINGQTKSYNWETSKVWVISQTDYPTLDLDGEYFDVTEITDSISSSYNISTLSDLMGLQERVNNGTEEYKQTYVITADIDLSNITNWTPIGTDEHPFNGTLTCQTNADGTPLYKLTGLLNSASTGNGGLATTQYSGLFGVVGGKGKVSNIVVENPSIKKGQYVAAIASKNYGIISNCQVIATNKVASIQTNNVGYGDENVVYVAGAVAYNEGTVTNTQVQGILVQVLNSISNEQIYIAGVVAYNLNTVENSSYVAYEGASNQIMSAQNVNTSLGGVVGYNAYLVSSSYASKIESESNGISSETNISLTTYTNNENIMLGGVVGENALNARITKSFAMVNAEGTNVGGIAGLNYGKISESYSVSNLTGLRVGGLVYNHANGEISDCYTGGLLSGVNESAVKSGFAHDVALIDSTSQTCAIRHCFSYNSFDGTGTNYYDVHSNKDSVTIRTNDYWFAWVKYSREQGYVIDSIFDYSVGEAKRTNKRTFEWDWVDYKSCEKIISDYTSNKDYYSYQEDTCMSTEQIKDEDGAGVFRTYGFNEDIWKLGDGEYPTLRNVVKAK